MRAFLRAGEITAVKAPDEFDTGVGLGVTFTPSNVMVTAESAKKFDPVTVIDHVPVVPASSADGSSVMAAGRSCAAAGSPSAATASAATTPNTVL